MEDQKYFLGVEGETLRTMYMRKIMAGFDEHGHQWVSILQFDKHFGV